MYRPPLLNMGNTKWRPPIGLHTSGPWGKPTFNGSRAPSSNFSNENHWCESCDRGFPTFELLEKHKGQHQKCNIDGCQFIAHPKVITRHIQMQHSSGLYNKIAKLDNPGEIQKWREERKKKYPTKSIIEKKAAEIKEKIDRGEKMGLKQTGRFNDNRTGTVIKRRNEFHSKSSQHKLDFKRKKTYTNTTQTSSATKPKPTQRSHKLLPSMDIKRKLQPFSGIQNIVSEVYNEDNALSLPGNDLIEDDDFEEKVDIVAGASSNIKPEVCGALSSLMCDYGSSDDEYNNQQNDKCIVIESENKNIKQVSDPTKLTNNTEKNLKNYTLKSESEFLVQNEISKIEENKSDDDSGPEEIKTNKIYDNEVNKVEENIHKKNIDVSTNNLRQKTQERSNLFKKPKVKLPSTLLTKLLRKEMQQERNVVLQCIRHIVKNNYFENNKTG